MSDETDMLLEIQNLIADETGIVPTLDSLRLTLGYLESIGWESRDSILRRVIQTDTQARLELREHLTSKVGRGDLLAVLREAGASDVAIIKVRTGPEGYAWPIVEPDQGAWQSGAHRYAADDAIEVTAGAALWESS